MIGETGQKWDGNARISALLNVAQKTNLSLTSPRLARFFFEKL